MKEMGALGWTHTLKVCWHFPRWTSSPVPGWILQKADTETEVVQVYCRVRHVGKEKGRGSMEHGWDLAKSAPAQRGALSSEQGALPKSLLLGGKARLSYRVVLSHGLGAPWEDCALGWKAEAEPAGADRWRLSANPTLLADGRASHAFAEARLGGASPFAVNPLAFLFTLIKYKNPSCTFSHETAPFK